MNKRIVARWEALKGKRWLELYQDRLGYSYRGDGCGGYLPNLYTALGDASAIYCMEENAVATLRSDFPSVKRVR